MLRDFGEEIGIAPRHGDVAQRAYAPRRIDAHGHQKAAPGIGDFLERDVHSNLVIAIIFRREQPLRRIRPDHERSPRKQARLLEEGGRSREFDRRLPGELREPVSHRLARQRRLVDVGDRNFERQGLLPELFGDPRQRHMPLVHRVERTWQQHKGTRRRQHHLAVGLGGDAIELARQELIDRVRGPQRSSPQNVHPHRAGCVATVRQPRMRGPATGRSRAKRGLLQRRDHVGPWPSRPCSARCRQSWRMRCESDARLCADDRSPVPPSRRGQPDRCPPAPAWLRVPVRCVPSRSRCRHCSPVPVQSRETPRAPARRREPAPRSAAASRRGHEATRRSRHCRPR